jgi:hypothetical protein
MCNEATKAVDVEGAACSRIIAENVECVVKSSFLKKCSCDAYRRCKYDGDIGYCAGVPNRINQETFINSDRTVNKEPPTCVIDVCNRGIYFKKIVFLIDRMLEDQIELILEVWSGVCLREFRGELRMGIMRERHPEENKGLHLVNRGVSSEYSCQYRRCNQPVSDRKQKKKKKKKKMKKKKNIADKMIRWSMISSIIVAKQQSRRW